MQGREGDKGTVTCKIESSTGVFQVVLICRWPAYEGSGREYLVNKSTENRTNKTNDAMLTYVYST